MMNPDERGLEVILDELIESRLFSSDQLFWGKVPERYFSGIVMQLEGIVGF